MLPIHCMIILLLHLQIIKKIIMAGLFKIVTLVLSVMQTVLTYLGNKTLIQKGRLEKDNAALKETLRRTQLSKKVGDRSVPADDTDIVNRL